MRVLVQDQRVDWRELDSANWPAGVGQVVALCIQGITFEGADHYAVLHDSDGIRVAWWSDGEPLAQVWRLLPLAVDPLVGNRINTRQERGALFVASIPSSSIRHGKTLTDDEREQHQAARAPHGWREWSEGLPAEHLDEHGHARRGPVR